MRIFILGDSTAMSYPPSDAPKAGWGQYLQEHFGPSAQVVNHAIGARSTKSFISEGRLLAVEEASQPGDWALLQFGHNDNATSLVWRRTYPETSFLNNLRLMVCALRLRGANTIMLTPVCQRAIKPDGTVEDTFPAYVSAVREIAGAEGLPLLDIRQKTLEFVAALPAEESAKLYMHFPPGAWPAWPDGAADNTHTSFTGAEAFAALVANAIRESGLPLADWLKEGGHD